jgi:nicotinamide mononucleotide transporter
MDFSIDGITNAFLQMSAWEGLAVLFGVAYILLAAKESLWTWLFAFLSTIIYTILFWEGALVSSSLLNFYYMIMAVYGFILWRNGGDDSEALEVTRWSLKTNILLIFGGIVSSIVLGYISDTYTEANYAYLDTFVMVFSIIATWMLAKKVLENWLYWIVIDSTAIVLYWKSGYLATIVLFTLYVVLAIYAYYTWSKSYSKKFSNEY